MERAGAGRDGNPSRGRRVALYTLGCKINQYDTHSIAARLAAAGHTVVSRMADADVILVNTCTVTGRTDYKGRQLVRRAVQQNPGAVVIVAGCYAQVQPEALAAIPGVDYVLGTAEKLDTASWISTCTKQAPPVIRTGRLAEVSVLDSGPVPVHSGNTRAFLKIQDGCDHRCAYCIVPMARGRSRSLPEAVLWEKLGVLAHGGYREVVLCGIHLGRYGLDLSPPVPLVEILARLEREALFPRVRISSVEPNELSQALMDLFAGARHLCPHFHLPLQSGDAGILKAMNRPYGPSEFDATVREIHERMPDAAIGVDVIAGFPGETEAAFRNTVSLLESLPVSYLHVFPYSQRPHTPAALLPDPVPPDAVRQRAAVLRKLGRHKRLRFHERFLGRQVEVLAETRRDPQTGMLRGVTRSYVNVLFHGPDDLQRGLVGVRVLSVDEKQAVGEAVV